MKKLDKFKYLEESLYFISYQENDKFRLYIYEDECGRGWINVPLSAYNEIYWEYANLKGLTIHRSPWMIGEYLPDWFVSLISTTLLKIEKRDRLRRLFK